MAIAYSHFLGCLGEIDQINTIFDLCSLGFVYCSSVGGFWNLLSVRIVVDSLCSLFDAHCERSRKLQNQKKMMMMIL